MLDFYTKISLAKNAPRGAHAKEETRKLMRQAAWLAVAFDERSVTTISFRHEVWDNNLKTKAAPNTPAGTWPAMVTHIVKDYVCPRWTALPEIDGATTTNPDGSVRQTTNDERDQFMVDDAKAKGLIFISADKRARRRAGARAIAPAAYAHKIISIETARKRFLERLEIGIAAWLVGRPRSARDAADFIRDEYEAIWKL